jgi:hypothetical protein
VFVLKAKAALTVLLNWLQTNGFLEPKQSFQNANKLMKKYTWQGILKGEISLGH